MFGETQTVKGSEMFSHQYMTNVQDPYSQSDSLFSAYTNNGLSNKSLSFVIPVYENMPEKVYKPSTIDKSKQELYYADISSNLIVRSKPTTNSNIIATIYKDDLVIMLQKSIEQANGYTWDKVQLWNGKIAYIPNKYLKKFTKTQEPIPPTNPPVEPPVEVKDYGYADVNSYLKIRSGPGTTYEEIGRLEPKEEAEILEESQGWYKVRKSTGLEGYVMKEYFIKYNLYKIEENLINIAENTDASIIAKGLGKTKYTVKDKKGNVVDGKLLGTGHTIIFDDITYTIVKKGDINGDGLIKSIDYMYIKNIIMDRTPVDEFQKKAADLNHDNEIKSLDYMYIKNIIMDRMVAEL